MKKYVLIGAIISMILPILLFITIFISDEEDEYKNSTDTITNTNLSSEVLAHKDMVEKYCKEFGISNYVYYILAIIQVESGGTGKDVMQSSESLGLAPNSLTTEESIKQGCKYFSELLEGASKYECDIGTVVQAYNMGGGFTIYVSTRGKQYTYELAESYAKEKSGGVQVNYPNPIAIPVNGGKRYNYGNQFYKLLVDQYLIPTQFDDVVFQSIMDEALKYQGWEYIYGGASPTTSFDCSGLVQWCYKQANITLPRTAQQQYDTTTHIALSEAKAGDLLFFHSTYNAGTYITHVTIYLGNNFFYHAGDPIGYGDFNDSYWQEHFAGVGRITK